MAAMVSGYGKTRAAGRAGTQSIEPAIPCVGSYCQLVKNENYSAIANHSDYTSSRPRETSLAHCQMIEDLASDGLACEREVL
ncbi:unnamed protein product, partial [Iphiclides podalirius]